MTTLLIDPHYLKTYTILNDSVDDTRVYPAILLAQDKHLQIYLGSKLYKRILADVATDTLSGEYLTLADDYVNRMLAWWTLVELLPDMMVSIDNTGVTTRSGANSSPTDKAYLDTLIEKCRQNANFYTQRLIDYLRWNTHVFPEYTTNVNHEIPPDYKTHFQAGLTISGRTNLLETKLRHIIDIRR